MDSLYVRLKFGMLEAEFLSMKRMQPILDLLCGGAIELYHSTHPTLHTEGPVVTKNSTYRIRDRHKFLEWAKNCGLYDDLALENLEYLICQEIMNEVAQ